MARATPRATRGHLTLRLPAAVTEALLTRVPARLHGGIQEVLLTALAVAVADWCRRQHRGDVGDGGAAGSAGVLLDVEGHGREDVFGAVDLSRTVGWFTSLYPVRLDVSGLEVVQALAGGAALGGLFKAIKEQLRGLPRRGLGYGLLRYLNKATAGELAGLSSPQLSFNYLGRFAAGGEADWSGASEGEGLSVVDAGQRLSHVVALDAITLDGARGSELAANWTWAPSLISETQVRALAEGWFAALEALVVHAAQPGSGGRSPSDLALVRLTQAAIERLERAYPEIEDILPVTPLQEGLLFHALYDAGAPDVYTVQLDLELLGTLDAAALAAAAALVVVRHASLRACFWQDGFGDGLGDGQGAPVAVIVPRAQPPWRLIDLSMVAQAERETAVTALLAQDRLDRFDVTRPPLLRFALVRLSDERHRLVLSSHHILMDGWSAPVLVRELLALYARPDAALPAVTPYRDYLAWLAGQDRAGSAAFWRQTLSGLEAGTRLVPSDPGRMAVAPEPFVVAVGAELSAALVALARGGGVTLNSVLQAAWGILLGRLSGRSDVVFGVTVAGRPAELAGVEHMVGLFINTLPLRLKLVPGEPLSAFLRQTQASGSELMAHGTLGLSEIQQIAGVGELFDTLMVFENYPVDREGLAAEVRGLRLGRVGGHDATHYPLSLMVRPGEELTLRLDYRPDLFDRGSVAVLGERLVRLLANAVAAPERPIGSLEILSAAERHTILSLWNDTEHEVAQPTAGLTLPELFAAQAERTPAAIAVVFEDRTLSYAELEAHANQLAHHLRGLGVGPETVVGLCVERSPEMVVGLLGILKAGGAYLPLDPSYPPERLSFMLADAGASVLVTQAALTGRLPPANAGNPARAGAARRRLGRHRSAANPRPGRRARPRQPRLRHLHIRINRNTKGRRRNACGIAQLPRRDEAAGAAHAG